MTQVKGLRFNEIRGWIRSEVGKGRSEREVVAELAAQREDVVLLSATSTPEEVHQQVIQAVQPTANS